MSEADLIARARDGDRAATSDLLARYAGALWKFVYSRTGLSQERAEDILQETLTAAVVGIRKYRGDAGVLAWLTGIARHKIDDHLARLYRDQKVRLCSAPSLVVLIEEWQSRHMNNGELDREDVREALSAALGSLPIDVQRLLADKYERNLSVQQIAGLYNRTPKSVEAALHRARCAFRESVLSIARQMDVRLPVMRQKR